MCLSELNSSYIEIDECRPKHSIISQFSVTDSANVFQLNQVNELQISDSLKEFDTFLISINALTQDLLNSLESIVETDQTPIALFVEKHQPEMLETAINAGVSYYFEGVPSLDRLPAIIDLAKCRFKQLHTLKSELSKVQTKLDDRKLIEKAKGILMQKNKLSEDQAYQQIRRSAMNRSITMAKLSQQVISVYEMAD